AADVRLERTVVVAKLWKCVFCHGGHHSPLTARFKRRLAAAADLRRTGVILRRERAARVARRARAAHADLAELLALIEPEAETHAAVAGRALAVVGGTARRAALALRSRRQRGTDAVRNVIRPRHAADVRTARRVSARAVLRIRRIAEARARLHAGNVVARLVHDLEAIAIAARTIRDRAAERRADAVDAAAPDATLPVAVARAAVPI